MIYFMPFLISIFVESKSLPQKPFTNEINVFEEFFLTEWAGGLFVIIAPTCKQWRADQRCKASACWRASPLERPGQTLLVVIRVVQVE